MLDLFEKLLNDPDFCNEVKYKYVKWNKYDYIFREGDPYQHFYIIKLGSVSISVNGYLEGKQSVHPGIVELKTDDIFGMFGLIDGGVAGADAKTLEDTETLEIEYATFSRYLDLHPDIGYQITKDLLKRMVTRLRKADKTIVQLYVHCLKVYEVDKYLD